MLARQTRALASHRQGLADGMERAAQAFLESAITSGSSLAGSIGALEGAPEEAWDPGLKEAQEVLQGSLDEAAKSLAESIRQEVTRQMADLRAEMAEIDIEGMPQARWLIKVQPNAAEKRAGFWARRSRPEAKDVREGAAWLLNVQSHLADVERVWGELGVLRT